MASFFVAAVDGKLAGCCALQINSKRIADFQACAVASRLVKRCVDRARERGVRELFAVTSRTSFFGRLGFATFRREKIAMFYESTPRPASA